MAHALYILAKEVLVCTIITNVISAVPHIALIRLRVAIYARNV